MRIEADAARAQVVRFGFAFQADVAQQACQKRAVDLLVIGRLVADAPALLVGELHQLAVHVAPLAHATHREEVLLAGRSELAIGELVTRLLEKRPQLQVAGKLGLLVLEARMRLVGRSLAVERPVARVLHGQSGGDDEQFGQRLAVAAAQDHAADARVERQPRQLLPGGREQVVLAQGAKFLEELVAVGDRLGRRRFQKRERLDLGKPKRLHAQDHRGQRGAQDLRVGETRARGVVGLVVQAYADAGGDPAAASGALVCGGLGDLFHLQLLDLVAIAVALDAR